MLANSDPWQNHGSVTDPYLPLQDHWLRALDRAMSFQGRLGPEDTMVANCYKVWADPIDDAHQPYVFANGRPILPESPNLRSISVCQHSWLPPGAKLSQKTTGLS